jgi:hypothetical protein
VATTSSVRKLMEIKQLFDNANYNQICCGVYNASICTIGYNIHHVDDNECAVVIRVACLYWKRGTKFNFMYITCVT